MVDVPGFVAHCLQQGGGLAEPLPDEEGVVEALVPEPFRSELGTGEIARLVFDAAVATEDRDTVPVLVGSRALDVFVQYASELGRVSRAFPIIDDHTVRPRPLQGEISHALTFSARRVRLPEGPAMLETGVMAQFDFVAALVSDERDEILQSIVVDLWTGRFNPSATAVCNRIPVRDTGAPPGRRVLVSPAQAREEAHIALKEQLKPRVERHQSLITQRLRDEHARLGLYYNSLVDDLERRLERVEADPDKARDLRAKIEATRRERDAKLHELSDKYRLRPTARLAAVRLLIYPRLFATVGLDRKQVSRELELAWDPLVGRLQLPFCEGCGREARQLELTLTARLWCPECVAASE